MNRAEQEVRKTLESAGYEVLKNGYPDFVAIRGDEIRFIEVKTKNDKIRAEQRRMFRFIKEKLGFNVEIMKVADEKTVTSSYPKQKRKKAIVHKLIDRGLDKSECFYICNSGMIPLEPRLFFRLVYEGSLTPYEVQNLLIECWERETGGIRVKTTKVKYNPTTKNSTSQPKHIVVSEETNKMLREYVSQRKKGFIFLSGKTGKQLTVRHFEKLLNTYARLLSIQKDKSVTESGRKTGLVTLKELKEAGEEHRKTLEGCL